MTQLDPGLLAAIIADPKNDDIRLIAADWLDEHGECDRAEFIRVQVELARTPRWLAYPCKVCGATPCEGGEISHGRGCFVASSDGGWTELADENPAWTSLQDRERELLLVLAAAQTWDFGIPSGTPGWHCPAGETSVVWTAGQCSAKWTLSRGFVSHATLSAADWLRHADRITAATPLERVTLTTMPDMAMGDRNDKLQLMGHKSKAWHRIPLSGRSRVGAAEESTEVRLLKRYWPRIKFVVLSYQPGPILARVATIGSFPPRDTGRLRSSIGPTI